jgi:hypothetical protein
MKKYSVSSKIIAFVLVFAFTFQSMESINSHTYKIGVDSYHYHYGCFGISAIHLACKCPKNNSLRNSCQLFN